MTTPTENNLTEKYVHAATRSLPEEMRGDVAEELRTTLSDRVEAIVAETPGTTADEAEYAAVAELDDPDRLAAAYTGRPLHLVGPEAYPQYVRVLKRMLVTALPVVALASVLADLFIDQDHSVGGVIGGTIWFTLNVAVHLAFWTTLLWVIVERSTDPRDLRRTLGDEWDPDRLPDPPGPRAAGRPELVTNLVFLVLFVAVLVGQQFTSWLHEADGTPIPVLDPDLWKGWLPALIGLLLAEMAFELVRYRAGGWTTRLAVANTVLAVAGSGLVAWLAATDRLLNPLFVQQGQASWSAFDPTAVNISVLLSAVVIALWDIVDGWRKAVVRR